MKDGNIMLTFVKAGIDNVGLFGAIHASCWQDTYKGVASDEFLSRFTPEKRAAAFSKAIKNPAENFYLAVTGSGKAMGIVIFRQRDGGDGEVMAIYILSEYKRRGFGRETMDFAIGELKKAGCSRIILWVLEKNLNARAFYEKYGFRYSGEKREIDVGSTQQELKYFMNL